MPFLSLCSLRCLCSLKGKFSCLGQFSHGTVPERDTLHRAGGEGKKRLLLVSVCVSIHMHKTTLMNEGVSGARDKMHRETVCRSDSS